MIVNSLNQTKKSLQRILVRFYPPGIILEFTDSESNVENKSIDLLNLSENSDTDYLVDQIITREPLTKNHRKQLEKIIKRLIEVISEKKTQTFSNYKTLPCHDLPLTNCAFNKNGDKFITGSYDQTCIIWNTDTGEILHRLKGHRNVVYAIAFNLPYGDKVATGSFDQTTKLWNVEDGSLISTLRGHKAEIVCLSFDPLSLYLVTGSMDRSAILWNLETEQTMMKIDGHAGEVISISFNTDGDKILTGSFDFSAKVWDYYSGDLICDLKEHTAEISACQFNYSGTQIVTSSIDKTCKLWDLRNTSKSLATFIGHTDEILDVTFNLTGTKIASASSDHTAKIYNTKNLLTEFTLSGNIKIFNTFIEHNSEISKLCFNSRGNVLMTGSSDTTVKLWDVETGTCKQTLEGHKEEIFSCAFNYDGNTIITASKDNTCRIWKDQNGVSKL